MFVFELLSKYDDVSKWWLYGLLNFQNFDYRWLHKVKILYHAKFQANQSNCCWNWSFSIFQDGSRPPSCIFNNSKFDLPGWFRELILVTVPSSLPINRAVSEAIVWVIKMVTVRCPRFLKSEILTADATEVNVPNVMQIGQTLLRCGRCFWSGMCWKRQLCWRKHTLWLYRYAPLWCNVLAPFSHGVRVLWQ